MEGHIDDPALEAGVHARGQRGVHVDGRRLRGGKPQWRGAPCAKPAEVADVKSLGARAHPDLEQRVEVVALEEGLCDRRAPDVPNLVEEHAVGFSAVLSTRLLVRIHTLEGEVSSFLSVDEVETIDP